MRAPLVLAAGPGGAPGGRAGALPLVLAAGVVLLQVTYPLLDGAALVATTIATVLLFAATSVASAAATHGRRAAVALVGLAGGTGLLAEAVGVATGVPFGAYAYAHTLGPQVLGVPLLVPAAWLMMAWPCLLAGRALAGRAGAPSWAVVPLAAWALASWDVFLDPQMVAAGHWTWAHPHPALPGSPGVPLTNYAGWLAVALVMQALLHAAVPRRTLSSAPAGAADGTGAPAVLLAWTWLGSSVASMVFFGRPAVAAWGALAMGVVVGPYLVVLLQRRSRTRAPVPVG